MNFGQKSTTYHLSLQFNINFTAIRFLFRFTSLSEKCQEKLNPTRINRAEQFKYRDSSILYKFSIIYDDIILLTNREQFRKEFLIFGDHPKMGFFTLTFSICNVHFESVHMKLINITIV